MMESVVIEILPVTLLHWAWTGTGMDTYDIVGVICFFPLLLLFMGRKNIKVRDEVKEYPNTIMFVLQAVHLLVDLGQFVTFIVPTVACIGLFLLNPTRPNSSNYKPKTK
uniref:Uncharacterized protein n=1 Tax=Lotharella oceanica TaxID=641309 RepID=A0A7S2TRK2_9EUKA|mmetsp:Transcript_24068/g.44989  ORF Transcript_24068/g.44989 Transcript_24068/m.44989 type:complete len:109 (+) Transcript_24068:798-1124(+)